MINDEAKNYYFAVKNLSELNSSGWLRAKKDAIINGDFDFNFKDFLDDALNYQNIEIHPERISKLKPYINKYNWEGIDFLYIPCNTKTISVAYRSEYNNNCKKRVVLLMTTNSKKSHYLAVTYLHYLKTFHQIIKKIFIV